MLIYFKMALNIISTIYEDGKDFSLGLITAAVMLTATSIWFSYHGSHDVVYTRTTPPAMATIDASEKILQDEIANRRATIEKIEERSEKSIKAVVNRQVTNLEKLIAKDTEKLTTLAIARKSGDEQTLLQHGETKVVTTQEVRRFAIILNLLSLFIFSPLVGNFIIQSKLDYSDRLGTPLPKTSHTVQAQHYEEEEVTTDDLDPLKERLINGKNGSSPTNGILIIEANPQ